jgi:two-component system, OmpR family, heavy metal sensor histidine kinase CusS
MRCLSVRWTLTLWYGLVLATVLVAFGAIVYFMMRHELLSRLDVSLEQELTEIEEEVEEARDSERLQERLQRSFSRDEGFAILARRPDGRALFGRFPAEPLELPVPQIPSSLHHLDYESVPLGIQSLALGSQGRWRLASRLVPGPDGLLVIQAAGSLEVNDRELRELLAVLLLAGPIAVVGALAGGYLLARKALAPVDRMVTTVEQITATRLDQRLDVLNPDDELGRLAQTLNRMIARLESSFAEIRRFTADAAHELRTPLTVLRTEAEVALRLPRDPEHYRRVLEDMLEEVERLARLAEQLLFLCREDASLIARVNERLRLDELARNVVDHLAVVAQEKGQTLTLDVRDACPVRGDPEQLRRLLYNLVNNAIKFTPEGGSIAIACGRDNGHATLVVTDTGIGLPAEHLPHVFDRFYRVDPARGREIDGTGLGLAISRSIVEAHGGQIRVTSTEGKGTSFLISFPAATSSEAH